MLKCQFCEKELKNQGAKNLHEHHCKKNPKNQKPVSTTSDDGEFCLVCGTRNRLLNAKREIELLYIEKGFTMVCTNLDCLELE